MGIVRFETVNVNNVSISTDSVGQTVPNITLWFQTRARVLDIKNQDYKVLDRWSDSKKFKEYRIARSLK